MTYFLIEKMYTAFGDWEERFKVQAPSVLLQPSSTPSKCVIRNGTRFFRHQLQRLGRKRVVASVQKQGHAEHFQRLHAAGSTHPIRRVTCIFLANSVQLGYFYNDLGTLRVRNNKLQKLLISLKLLIRRNLTTATTRTIHLGKPYYDNDTKRLLSGRELLSWPPPKTWAPNLENQNWVQHTVRAKEQGNASQFVRYRIRPDQGIHPLRLFPGCICTTFKKYERLRTEEAPAYTMIQGWYNAFLRTLTAPRTACACKFACKLAHKPYQNCIRHASLSAVGPSRTLKC